ncbi:ABC transporter permease [Alcaligenaceae bacterium CGII-47]|nr:ABC transporter permease [Alcaligenaceae bacterium CGII-47]
MDFGGVAVQFLNGMAQASSLFLVAAGLSLIFGVTRIVNFAHGSLYMLGIYLAYSAVQQWGHSPAGFWFSLLAASLAVGALGALLEIILLRRIYRAPEMLQLLATFALVLIINDVALWIWGPDDLLGPLAPGLSGAIQIFGRYIPAYDLMLIVVGPILLACLWLLLTRTRWGALIRAATQDRTMLGALGVNQAWLFTSVFALGAFLAALGGAIQIPRQPASLGLDLSVIGDAFVVVVVGGMGSIPGAYLAALIIAQLKAFCIALGVVSFGDINIAFPKLTLVIEFIFMALVLVIRPWGLLGKPMASVRSAGAQDAPLRLATPGYKGLILVVLAVLITLPAFSDTFPYAPVLALDIIIAALFAASLHFIMGPGGMPSFGHAAYFGLGAYGAALLLTSASWPMAPAIITAPLLAGIGAVVFGWFCVRLTGIYLAMLTLAFAQIVWSIVYQWDAVTGGSNGIIGVWPASWLPANGYYYLALTAVTLSVYALRRLIFSPFGYALRAGRDSALRAQAIGIDIKGVQLLAFAIAGLFAGLAGALFVFSKGSASPELITVGKSVDGLIMVLLGGVQTVVGPLVGAATFTLLQNAFIGITQYWHAVLGGVILLLVMAFPQGIAGFVEQIGARIQIMRHPEPREGA